MSKNRLLSDVYSRAKQEGRLCSRCGWIITKRDWKRGKELCFNCEDALKGVNVRHGYGKMIEEPIDRTGEII